MKKTRLIAALLAASFIIGCTPVQAEGPRGRLRKVKKQLDESLNRFKRCMRGKCTRKEKIKVARDVGIAAAAAVLAVVGATVYAGKRIKNAAEAISSRPRAAEEVQPQALEFPAPKAVPTEEGGAEVGPPPADVERTKKLFLHKKILYNDLPYNVVGVYKLPNDPKVYFQLAVTERAWELTIVSLSVKDLMVLEKSLPQ